MTDWHENGGAKGGPGCDGETDQKKEESDWRGVKWKVGVGGQATGGDAWHPQRSTELTGTGPKINLQGWAEVRRGNLF